MTENFRFRRKYVNHKLYLHLFNKKLNSSIKSKKSAKQKTLILKTTWWKMLTPTRIQTTGGYVIIIPNVFYWKLFEYFGAIFKSYFEFSYLWVLTRSFSFSTLAPVNTVTWKGYLWAFYIYFCKKIKIGGWVVNSFPIYALLNPFRQFRHWI